MWHCVMTHSNRTEECMRTFSQSESIRLLTSLQVYKAPCLSQQHNHGCHRIQVHTNQYPQIPMFSLVPCPTVPNIVPTHSHPTRLNELPQNTFSNNTTLGDDVCNDSISVECPPTVDACSQRASTRDNMLTSVTRDRSSRRRALKAASRTPNHYPYTACNPGASDCGGIVRISCPVIVVASSPTFDPQLAALQRFKSTCCQSHAQPAHLRYADLVNRSPHRAHLTRATHAIFSCARGSRWLSGVPVLSFLTVISSHPCFTAPCLARRCLRASRHHFPHLHPVRRPLLCCSILQRVHPLPLYKEGYALAGWLNNHLSQVAASKPDQLTFEKGQVSARTSTTSPPLWIRLKCTKQQKWDGRPHHCFSQECEVGAIPVSVSGFQHFQAAVRPLRDVDPFSSIGKLVRDVEPFSRWDRPLVKGKRNRELESVQVCLMEKERILSEQKNPSWIPCKKKLI